MMRSHAIPRAITGTISGVLYAEDFDEPLLPPPAMATARQVAPVEPEVVTPRFSLDELRAATEQAHDEGAAYARQAAEQSSMAQRAAALEALVEQIAASRKQAAQIVEQALDGIACTALSLLAAALPALCASHAEVELRALLQRLLPPMRQAPELQIRLHPELREAIEQEASQLLEGSGTRVSWIESGKLGRGDIAIAWQNGGALRDTGATCAAIRDAVLGLLGPVSLPILPADRPQACTPET